MTIFSMHPFQFTLIVFFGFGAVHAAYRLLTQSTDRGMTALRLVLFVAATAAAIWPGATTSIAGVLGIGRGADLILYCAVVAMLLGFWMTYVRLTQLRREITLLVRRNTLQDAAGLIQQVRRSGRADAEDTASS